MPWWHDAVIYQVYVRSFQDSNGDGVGDLPGLIERLDHLAWLGVDAVWCSPITPSPDADWGYDVSDYTSVQPVFGTLADADRLIAEAGRRGIRVLLDIVPNHTSNQHPWFHDPTRRNWYVWADRPNNWLSAFGGPAWTLDPTQGRYYLHNFLAEQPDLNWWNQAVREEFDRILRFWFDRGVAGFRIDVAAGIVKDRELRDNPPPGPNDHPYFHRRGQVPLYTRNRPEVHDVLRRWHAVAHEYDPPRVFLGETLVFDVRDLADYVRSDELDLALNFPFFFAPFEPAALRAEVAAAEAALTAAGGWPVWCGSNHDFSRFPTRWAEGDEDLARCALVMLLTLRGTAVLYQGDEIAMPDVPVPPECFKDPFGPGERDPSRTPMRWTKGAGAGFTEPAVEPWLPLGTGPDVESQHSDPRSTLHLSRAAITLGRRLGGTTYAERPSPPGTWVYERGDAVVAINFNNAPASIEGVNGEIGLSTRLDRDSERVTGTLQLRPHEAAIVGAGSPRPFRTSGAKPGMPAHAATRTDENGYAVGLG